MAIITPPGWMGGDIVRETGNRSMAAAAGVVRLSVPLWMSTFKTHSKEIPITIGQSYGYHWDWLINTLKAQPGGLANGAFVVTITGDLVSYSLDVPTLWFPAELNQCAYVRIINNATIYGRGGRGAGDQDNNKDAWGRPGGVAIRNEIGGKLQIVNNGAIAGGGGGGGQIGASSTSNTNVYQAGGGGRPFGEAGYCKINGQSGYHSGQAGSIGSPGAGGWSNGSTHGGNGGDVGQPGQSAVGSTRSHGSTGGGAAGAAVVGNAPSWQRLGAIYGARV